MAEVPVIAVDGPSGSGKGTLAQDLARRLAWHYLDSGALYRIVALAALERSVELDAGAALATLAGQLTISFSPDRLPPTVWLDGRDVTRDIRAEPVSVAASRVAAHPELRSALIATQRSFRRTPGLVADGRDMGTVVFPDARLKIFLEASAEERAERRYKQLKDKDLSVSLRALLASIRERDARDRERAASPLVAAADAFVIDSTGLTIEGVQERAWQCVVAAGLV